MEKSDQWERAFKLKIQILYIFFDNNGEKIGVDSSWREYLEPGK